MRTETLFSSFPLALTVTIMWPLALLAILVGCARLERFIQRPERPRARGRAPAQQPEPTDPVTVTLRLAP